MQAILDANRNTHEYVREAIVNNDKVIEIDLSPNGSSLAFIFILASCSCFSIDYNRNLARENLSRIDSNEI